jgi:hypothetical protein
VQNTHLTAIAGRKIGLLVCFDVEFLDPAMQLLQQQAHLRAQLTTAAPFHNFQVNAVLVPMFWVNTPPLSWSTLIHPHSQHHFCRHPV